MENAERSVIFKLMAVADPASQAVLAAFGKQMEEAQARSLQATVTRSKAVVAIAAAESKAVVAAATDHVKKVEAIDSAAVAQKKYTMEELTAMEEAENSKRAEATRKMYEEQASWEKQHNDKKAKEEEAAAIKAAFKKADAVAAAASAAEAEAAKSASKTEFKDKAKEAMLEEIEKGIAEREAAREKEAQAKAKRLEEEEAAHAKAQKSMSDKAKAAADSAIKNFDKMASASLSFARGLTAIGLVGEKDINKVKDALLSVQGAIDSYQGLKGFAEAASKNASAVKAGTAISGALEGATGLAAGGSPIAVLGAAAAAAAGALFGAVSSVEFFRESLKHGIGGGATKGGYTDTVGGSGYNPFNRFFRQENGWDSAMSLNPFWETNTDKSRRQSQEGVDKLEARKAQVGEMNKNDRAAAGGITKEQNALAKEQLAIQESILHRKYEQADAAGKSRIIESEIAKYSKEASKGDPTARGHIITWLEKRLTHEKEISRVAKDAATQSLKASKDQLKSIEDQIKARQQANMSARESFGLKSEEDQQEIISIKKRVDQGDQSVTGEELSKIKGLSGRTDKQIAAIAGKRASQAGFGTFQREEDTDINQLNSMKKKVEMEIKQKTDVVVKIDRDIEAEATNIAKKIMAQQAMQDQELAKRVAEMTKEMDVIKQRFFQRNHGGTL